MSPLTIVSEDPGYGGDGYRRTRTYIGASALPTSAAPGQSGTYARVQYWVADRKLAGDGRVDWSLEADTQTTGWACMTVVPPAGLGWPPRGKTCLRIDTAGAIRGLKVHDEWGAGFWFDARAEAPAVSQPTAYTRIPAEGVAWPAADFRTIDDSSSWQSYWAWIVPTRPLPPVDFAQQRVAAAVLGRRAGGCRDVALVSLLEWPDRISIRYKERLPAPGVACAPVYVSPALMLAIPRADKPVRWVANEPDPLPPPPDTPAPVTYTALVEHASVRNLLRDELASVTPAATRLHGPSGLPHQRFPNLPRWSA